MHSSRMRTAHSLTISHHIPCMPPRQPHMPSHQPPCTPPTSHHACPPATTHVSQQPTMSPWQPHMLPWQPCIPPGNHACPCNHAHPLATTHALHNHACPLTTTHAPHNHTPRNHTHPLPSNHSCLPGNHACPPPVDRIRDACGNITLLQLRCGR